jgi:nucleotide-binding universal stress UspA family protein
MKTVLAPIDFSSVSRRVVDEAIAVARAIDGRLVLLHIVAPVTTLPTELAASKAVARANESLEQEAAAQLAELQKELRNEGVTAHAVHQIGTPGPAIVEQAERLDADYIVMGSHGHGAFYDLIVGSTTTRVLKQAKCAVMIVPPDKKRSKLAAGASRKTALVNA